MFLIDPKMSAAHPNLTVTSFSDAESACRSDGTRLWQPRNLNFFHNLVASHADDMEYAFTGKNGINAPIYYAAGWRTVEVAGERLPVYSDGAFVPVDILDEITHDFSGEEGEDCVALGRRGRMVSVKCDGYKETGGKIMNVGNLYSTNSAPFFSLILKS